MPISLLVITKNESQNIQKYWNWVGECPTIKEVIVVDDSSSDDTLAQIKKHQNTNTKVQSYTHPLNQDFSQQRNFGISKTSQDWILWLDADETPTPKLLKFLQEFNPTDHNHTYSFIRQNVFINQPLKHTEGGRLKQVRLFPKGSGKFVGSVHEIYQTNLPTIALNHHLLHYSHPNLKTTWEKINFYSQIRAQELSEQHYSANIITIVIYPLAKFIQNYFFKLGFLDSTAGLIFSLSLSFSSFLVRAKLWHLNSTKPVSI
jgi:glycosyltransferase involved in cell wall biosynthesis